MFTDYECPISAPAAFDVLFQALKTVMSKETQDAVRIYGYDRRVWQTKLLEVVPADQLDEAFGGTRNKFQSSV